MGVIPTPMARMRRRRALMENMVASLAAFVFFAVGYALINGVVSALAGPHP